MKKGFTLVELLAVIIILAIILAIAVPGISSIIESSQINAFKSNERMLLKAAKTYVEVNDSGLPVNIGDTNEITLETLQANNYISSITAPDDKMRDCNGYVIITKIDESNYDYTPHLNCQSDIGSSSEDGLVAHYKFDDFQEPTINYIPDAIFLNKSFQKPYTSAARGTIEFVDMINPVGNVALKHTASLSDSYTQPYIGSNAPITNVTPGETWTFSVYAKSDVGNVPIQLYIFSLNLSHSYSVLETDYFIADEEWQRYDITMVMPSDAVNIAVRVDNDGGVGKIVYWAGMQLEKKAYTTPFVNGTRSGTVKDYSMNSYDVNLALGLNPRWIYNEDRKSGVYDFNGGLVRMDTSQTISISGLQPRTIMGWVNTRNGSIGTSQFTVLASHGISDTGNDFSLGIKSNKVAVGYWGSYTEGNTLIENNKWYHLAATYDGVTTKLYLNGILDGSQNKIINTPIGTIKIGNRANDVHTLNGLVDDVYLYNRALTASEIKQLYNAQK